MQIIVEAKQTMELCVMKCNACGSEKISQYNVGKSSVSGYRCDTAVESLNEPLFDIALDFCTECNLVSQRRYAEADRLLDKLYEEHVSTQHSEENPYFHNFAKELGGKYALSKKSKVLEIGCNCGAFLKVLRDKTDANVFGIEPSKAMSHVWAERGLFVVNQYMDLEATSLLRKDGPFDIIYFRHVFEHVPNPVEFIRLAQSLLSEDGAIVLEVPYLHSIFKYGRVENISYSHLQHYCIRSLDAIFTQFGMGLTGYELVANDGGSIIAHFKRNIQTQTDQLEDDLQKELEGYLAYGLELKERAHRELRKYKKGEVVGYGAGAKGQHLIHVLSLDKFISRTVDDTPGFEGKFIPGTAIEISNKNIFEEENVKAVMNLAPTHYDVIKHKAPRHLAFLDFINQ